MTTVMTAAPAFAFGVRAEVGESPVWDERGEDILWVDVLAGRIHRRNLHSRRAETISLEGPVGSIVLTGSGSILASAGTRFVLVAPMGQTQTVATIEGGPSNTRLNHSHCDPQGRLWAGTMETAGPNAIGVCTDLVRTCFAHRMLDEVSCSNGIGWSRDGGTMYFVDFRDTAGVPDGLYVDREGGLSVALCDGGQVRRYSPDGELDLVVLLSVLRPTGCPFGGPDLGTLLITTASIGSDPDELGRGAGGIFSCRPGVVGVEPARFGGL